MAKQHWKIQVTGKVQGVWYRGSARQKALELGLRGFVANQPDGSVCAEVEGERHLLESFVAWCRQGPELARVENVSVAEGTWAGFEDFSVKR